MAWAIQQNLDDAADVTVWDQNVFKLTKSTLENLVTQLSNTDAAIFVFAPDDLLRIRKNNLQAVRDNVVFELGLFMGKLGSNRTFIVSPKNGRRLRIPSDLAGITVGHYNAERADGNWRAALGPFCSEVHDALSKLRPVSKPRAVKKTMKRRGDLYIKDALYGARHHRVNVARKLNSLIKNGRLNVYVGNQLGGDPCPNTPKDLIVNYVYKGIPRGTIVPEGGDLVLPQ